MESMHQRFRIPIDYLHIFASQIYPKMGGMTLPILFQLNRLILKNIILKMVT